MHDLFLPENIAVFIGRAFRFQLEAQCKREVVGVKFEKIYQTVTEKNSTEVLKNPVGL